MTQAEGKHLFTIPAGAPFADALAAGLIARHGTDPLTLARVTVLLPTRRACRALREALLRATDGAPTLLPRIRPIGDVEDDEPAFLDDAGFDMPLAVPPLQRAAILARFVMARPEWRGDAAAALRLAGALAELLDSAAIEGVGLDNLERLVPGEYADHWRRTVEFLDILRREWPAALIALDALDPADRQVRLIRALAARWRAAPPPDPVTVAGSTGTIPATAELMEVVAGLPNGTVVLPGLDVTLDDAAWTAARGDPCHPQCGLAVLLERLAVRRDAVRPWPHGEVAPAAASRAALLAQALLPAAVADRWVGRAAPPDAAFVGLGRIEAASAHGEGAAIALVLRQAIETPGRTAALVSPDRSLARRVAAELHRWGVEVDDSAGLPLATTPPGGLARLAVRALSPDAGPHDLLAMLKHPLAGGGRARAEFLRLARRLEIEGLRGPRPRAGLEGLRRAAAGAGEYVEAWFGGLTDRARPLAALLAAPEAAAPALLEAHAAFAEWLSATEDGSPRLYAGEAGEALASRLAEMREALPQLGTVAGRSWPSVFDALLDGATVRPMRQRHPRLFIWGPLEARLQRADTMVLGGLNEGAWPPEPSEDPWLSRPMRAGLGLPPHERRIGLSAHDFAQAFAAPRVVLSRSTRVEGAPTVPSRWLLRLDALLKDDARWRAALGPEARWAERLDDPVAPARPLDPPRPRPPVAARPRRLSVTEIETWIRDPYAIYARRILDLDVLEPIDAEPGAADRGLAIHAALNRFVAERMAADPLAELIGLGEEAFAEWRDRPNVRAFWWPRFLRIAEWFVAFERDRRALGFVPVGTELSGRLVLAGPGGAFELRARADRIDRRADGLLSVLDYKTGAAPSSRQVLSGLAPQLPLEAAIAQRGGFGEAIAAAIGELAYIHLRGGDPAGEVLPIPSAKDFGKTTAQALADATLAKLLGRIADFDDPAEPYRSRPRPQWLKHDGDYDHLARVKEWSARIGEAS